MTNEERTIVKRLYRWRMGDRTHRLDGIDYTFDETGRRWFHVGLSSEDLTISASGATVPGALKTALDMVGAK